MTQLEVIPLRIIEFRPFSPYRTAHAIGRGLAEDGDYYVIKGDVDGDPVCATEWLCNSIADSLNLPTAPWRALQMESGELVFGSQQIKQKIPDIEMTRLLLGGAGNDVYIPQLREVLSSTYALDLAIGNMDRHQDNFIIELGSAGPTDPPIGHARLIDFGAANLLRNRKSPLPFPAHSNTVLIGRAIRKKHGFALEAANELLSRFSEGKKFIADRAISGLPANWLSHDKRRDVVDWICGSAFENRLKLIETGLNDGSYL